MSATFIDDPARIVIDTVALPTPEPRLFPAVGDLSVILPLDAAGTGVALPTKVLGYARPFEANALVRLRAYLTVAVVDRPGD